MRYRIKMTSSLDDLIRAHQPGFTSTMTMSGYEAKSERVSTT
jgi:hypothetical protein